MHRQKWMHASTHPTARRTSSTRVLVAHVHEESTQLEPWPVSTLSKSSHPLARGCSSRRGSADHATRRRLYLTSEWVVPRQLASRGPPHAVRGRANASRTPVKRRAGGALRPCTIHGTEAGSAQDEGTFGGARSSSVQLAFGSRGSVRWCTQQFRSASVQDQEGAFGGADEPFEIGSEP